MVVPRSFADTQSLTCTIQNGWEPPYWPWVYPDLSPDPPPLMYKGEHEGCSTRAVSAVELRRNNLFGSIPPEIGQLWGLRVLDLSQNHIAGTFPVEMGQLHLLEVVDLLLVLTLHLDGASLTPTISLPTRS